MKTKKFSKADIVLLEKQDTKTLASWWSALNNCEWPDEVPNSEDGKFFLDSRRNQIMGWIANHITLKECLRDWSSEFKTDSEFESWWAFRWAGKVNRIK